MVSDGVQGRVYGVVLAGGSGERLWPLSRKNRPKQLLSLGQKSTLLAQAIERLRSVDVIDVICVVSAKEFSSRMARYNIDELFVEPCARNTGPAMLYCCRKIQEKDPHAIVLFVPADAFIPSNDTAVFGQQVSWAIQSARAHEKIIVMGARPTHAATGYGYIEYDASMPHDGLYNVRRFHEKPSKNVAAGYVARANFLWNIGICVAPVALYNNAFAVHAPVISQAMHTYLSEKGAYEDIPAVSFDYAIMEKIENSMVLPIAFAWSDVGTLETFLSIKCAQTVCPVPVISIDAHNSLVDVRKKIVALVGVDDLCVIETEDALVISTRTASERIREVVAQLKKDKHVELL